MCVDLIESGCLEAVSGNIFDSRRSFPASGREEVFPLACPCFVRPGQSLEMLRASISRFGLRGANSINVRDTHISGTICYCVSLDSPAGLALLDSVNVL